jgi:hypothetical protein
MVNHILLLWLTKMHCTSYFHPTVRMPAQATLQ